MIIARKNFPAKDVQELIDWLKANPDKATAATVGAAGGAQVAGMYFQQATGTSIRIRAVSRRRTGDAGSRLRSGRFHVRSGRQRHHAGSRRHHQGLRRHVASALASGARHPDHRRSPACRDCTFRIGTALWAPKGTPKDVIAKLNAAVVSALADPKVQQRYAAQGQDIWPRDQQTPEALAALHKAEIDKWWPIIRAAHLKAE